MPEPSTKTKCDMAGYKRQRRALQCAVFIAACVPVGAGAAGMLGGTAWFTAVQDSSLDSHFRYLSGLLCALGLNFWWMIPRIEIHGAIFRVLTSLVVLGGLARLVAAIFVAAPSIPMQLAIGMELIVTPLLYIWQGRIARMTR